MTARQRVELVAIAEAGEVYISRDGRGRVWRHARYLPGDPVLIGEGEAERAIDAHGYRRIGETFDDWQALGARVDALTPKEQILAEDFPISRRLALALLPVLWQKASDPAERDQVVVVVGRLLSSPLVRRDDGLALALLALLTRSIPQPRSPQARATGSRMGAVQDFYEAGIGVAA